MITLATIYPFLSKDISLVYSNFPNVTPFWKDVYTVYKSERNYEIIYEASTLDAAQYTPEGQIPDLSTMQPIWPTQFNHRIYRVLFAMSRPAFDDNLYKEYFPREVENQRNSISLCNNVNGALPFNEAFTPSAVLSDGVPWASLVHPTSKGVFANTFPNPVGANESMFAAAWALMRYFPNWAGQVLERWFETVVIPPSLEVQIFRALGSPGDPTTSNRAINPINGMRMIPKINSNPFLVSPTSVFLLTNQNNGLVWYNRDPFETSVEPNMQTETATFVARIRNSQGIADPRCGVCVQ